ncbi:hypothetical protein KP003_19155 [Geomonas nitrogeniifigens]|uniref:hypothetical protein n=1 Tax=Geomonas diazotrophica TaxID=2843197 RepID=UPI001C2C2AA4|nr:hypothetical protein [Geomonas nitrogeniifigens]QXE86452.1 hypothetical protein KP003_19155 [Geomonas nitrogeniifigens]
MAPSCHCGNQEQQDFTVQQLATMIDAHVGFWSDQGEKSDTEVEAAHLLDRNCLSIAKQLLALLNLINTPLVAETRVEARP